jgi:hypothetical protein
MVHGSGLVQLSAHFHEKKKLQNRTLFYGNSVELQLLYMLLKPAFELVSWSGMVGWDLGGIIEQTLMTHEAMTQPDGMTIQPLNQTC